MSQEIQKFVGLTSAAARAIELHRMSPSETESDIIVRQLGERDGQKTPSLPVGPGLPTNQRQLDIGQGIHLNIGETTWLFLSKTDMIQNKPAATAKVTEKGLEINGRVFPQYRGSYVQQPMKHIQKLLRNTNEKGDIISLSAYRQWHVFRNRTLVPIEDLKDISKARKRSRALSRLTLDDLGL